MSLRDTRWTEYEISLLDEMTNPTTLRRELMKKLWTDGRRCTHRDFCNFRHALIPSPLSLQSPGYEHRFPYVSKFADNWIRGETGGRDAGQRFRQDVKAFADRPAPRGKRPIILDGDWRGQSEGATDAITGAILDGCLDCLRCMEVNGLLPGGVNGGPPEYNCTGYILAGIALAGEIVVMQNDYEAADIVPYRDILKFFIGRSSGGSWGPMIPATIFPNGKYGKCLFEVALESRVSTETLRVLARWYSSSFYGTNDTLFSMLHGNLGFELCRRADLFLVKWARSNGVELANVYSTDPHFGERTAWHALCHNPAKATLREDFLKHSRWGAGEPAGGRIPLCEAIERNDPEMVAWFLKSKQHPQNTWGQHLDILEIPHPSAIEIAIAHNHDTAATCLYLMMQDPNHIRIMKESEDKINGYRIRVARRLLSDFITAEDSKRSKAQEAGIAPELIELDINRLKKNTLLKFKAIIHGASSKWIREPEAAVLKRTCEEYSSCAFLRSFIKPSVRYDGVVPPEAP